MRVSTGVEQLHGELFPPTHTHIPLTQVERKVTHISLAEGWHTCVYISVPTPPSL